MCASDEDDDSQIRTDSERSLGDEGREQRLAITEIRHFNRTDIV